MIVWQSRTGQLDGSGGRGEHVFDSVAVAALTLASSWRADLNHVVVELQLKEGQVEHVLTMLQ